MRKFLSILILLFALVALVGCGEDKPTEEVKPTAVSITASNTTIEVGKYVNLIASVTPKGANQKVNWSSSDDAVATVSTAGRVTGKSEGTATITATSVEDSKLSGSVVITVIAASEDPNGGGEEIVITAINLEFTEEVFVDFDFSITVTTEPTGQASKIIWSSSNEEVATVSKGKIHGVKAGTCEIIAKANDVEQKLTITVKERPDLESFELKGLHDIDTNGVDQLSVETTPKYAKVDIEWSIDDAEVATIDETGLVTPLKEGEVNVTARDKATNITKTGKIVITKAFNPNEVEPTTVTVSGDTSCYVGYTIRLFAEVLPAGVSQEVTWSVKPEGLATINENGELTALAAGDVRVKATSVAGTKPISSAAFKVTIEVEPEPEPVPNLGGYKIVIMNAKSALSDIDPFLEEYKGVDKIYKQRAWSEIEEGFNCKIAVEPYPDNAGWGPNRVKWIKDNSMNNLSECDFGIVAAAWLSDFVSAGAAVDTTRFFKAYGKNQIEPSLREGGMIHNKLYVVSPGLSETKIYPYKGLFYNLGLLKKYNLESPAKLFNEDKWTYDDFVQYCIAAQSVMAEDEYVVAGASSILWAGMVNAAGVKLSDKVTITLNFTHTYSLEAARALRKIYEAGAWDPNNIDTVEQKVSSFQDGKALFQGGEYWFIRNNDRFPADMWGKNSTEFGYVPFPYPSTVGKANTRVNDRGDSLIMMVSGRNYPAGVTAKDVFRAVQEMYLNTIKYQKEDPTYNPAELKYNSVVTRVDDPESILATIWFTSARTIYDPLHEESFQNEWGCESATAIKNIVATGADPAREFESIEDAVLAKFRQTYS